MANLPTPDELGEQLKAGKITKEEAVEIMTERARREALAGLYGPPPDQAGGATSAAKAARVVRMISIMTLVLGLILVLLLIWTQLKK